jgi:dihydrodipicolinate synthase/N-acetylneuraminate lyase
MRIEGVIPILQTAFHQDGSLDLESLAREVRFAESAGVSAVAFPGFVSEWWKLSEEEIFASAQTIAAAKAPDTLFIANVVAQSTHVAERQAGRFASIGARALMALPPFLFTDGMDGVWTHLERILAAAPLPHILQYSASLTGASFQPRTLRALHDRFPHFSSVKVDFIPSGPVLSELKEAFSGTDVTFLIGFAGLQLPDAIARGADGVMPGTGHVRADVAVFEALRRDLNGGLPAFHRLLPLLNLEMQSLGTSIALHKRLLYEAGIFGSDHVRQPGLPLDDVQLRALSVYMDHADATHTLDQELRDFTPSLDRLSG